MPSSKPQRPVAGAYPLRALAFAALAAWTTSAAVASAGAAAAAAPAAATAAAAPAATAGGDAVDDSGPGQLIQTAAQVMLRELDANRAEFRKDSAKVDALVDRVLLPHFDTEYSARLVLARHWTGASPEQRKRFVDAFYHSLLSNYGSALVDFTGERLKVMPYKGDPAATNASIRTQVRKSDGSSVEVDYSLHRTDKGWRAWDVVIEGISYVKSFRDDFGAQIDQQGLDAVIARLEKQAAGKS